MLIEHFELKPYLRVKSTLFMGRGYLKCLNLSSRTKKKMYLLTKDTLHTKAVHLLLSFINFDTVLFVP